MELILYGHEGCCLCERLETLLRPCLGQTDPPIRLIRRDIAADRHWLAAYRHRIPVLMLGEQIVLEGNPSPEQVQKTVHALVRTGMKPRADEAAPL